jgi:hypothetical protein
MNLVVEDPLDYAVGGAKHDDVRRVVRTSDGAIVLPCLAAVVPGEQRVFPIRRHGPFTPRLPRVRRRGRDEAAGLQLLREERQSVVEEDLRVSARRVGDAADVPSGIVEGITASGDGAAGAKHS